METPRAFSYSLLHKLYQDFKNRTEANDLDSKMDIKANYKNEKYQLFCGQIHVKTRTLAIGICEILLHALFLIGAAVYVYGHASSWKVVTSITGAFLVILIPIYVCYFTALFTKNQFLFIFYLIVAAIRLLFFVVCVDALILVLVLSLDFGNKKHIIFQTIAFTIFAIISSAIQIRWMWIVIKCMKYFGDIKREKPSAIVLKY